MFEQEWQKYAKRDDKTNKEGLESFVTSDSVQKKISQSGQLAPERRPFLKKKKKKI